MSGLKRIYLVRHGEAEASWGQSADPGLSQLGRQQAQELAASLLPRLAEHTPTLLSSPLKRAQETAEPLARELGRLPAIDERFREIPSPVALEDRQAWLREFMRGLWVDKEAALHEWRRAIVEGIEALPDGSVVFTHFLVINTVLGHVEDRGETLIFWPANASVTMLWRDGASWQIERGREMHSRVN